MKILIINGSPRGKMSNSLQLTQKFIDGLTHKGNQQEDVQIEMIDVYQLHIEGCRGCFYCWKKGNGKCCIQDDMEKVLEKRLWADVIIWSFPLYYFSVPGTLKVLIDRQLPMVFPTMTDRKDGFGNGSHVPRYDFSKQRHVVISTCGFYTAKDNYDGVLSLFNHFCGKDNFETLFCGQGELFKIKESYVSQRTNSYLDLVYQAGQEFYNGKISQELKSKLNEYEILPKDIFEQMANKSW